MVEDQIIYALSQGRLNRRNICVKALRSCSARNDPVWHEELKRGRAIPQHVGHLNQYLWSYGKMVAAQWDVVAEQVADCLRTLDLCARTPVHLYDYGAGQGLSTLGLLGALNKAAHTHHDWLVSQILQLDPSWVALQRAAAIAHCLAPQARVHSQYAYRSNAMAMLAQQDVLHIHVFSNSIDVEKFQYRQMIGDALSASGQHLFVVVSNDRIHYGGTDQVSDAHRILTQSTHLPFWDTGLRHFTCNGSMRAVSFVTGLQVK